MSRRRTKKAKAHEKLGIKIEGCLHNKVTGQTVMYWGQNESNGFVMYTDFLPNNGIYCVVGADLSEVRRSLEKLIDLPELKPVNG